VKRVICYVLIGLIALKGVAVQRYGLIEQILRFRAYAKDGAGMLDPRCSTPFCDYSLFWLTGRLARVDAMATLYHPAAFFAFTSKILTHQTEIMPILYPPVMLPVMVIASLPKLAVGYCGFVVASFLLAVFALRRARLSWACIAIGLLGPAAVWNVFLGQFGIICGALLVSGLALLESSPVAGGVLLACLCIKPQYVLLMPVVLLASRNRRGLAAFVIAGGVLAALSVLWFGWSAWAAYLGPGRAATREWIQIPFGPGKESLGVSVFWLMRSFSAGLAAAYTAQAVATILAAGATWWLWSRQKIDRGARLAATVCLMSLASPYGYTDDLVGFSVVLALLVRRDAPVMNVVLAVLWLSPAYAGSFAERFGFLPMPFAILVLLGVACARCAPERGRVMASKFRVAPGLFGTDAVIASGAKQSSLFLENGKKTGLLRRFTPRNDGV
jgi:hypothetical protein